MSEGRPAAPGTTRTYAPSGRIFRCPISTCKAILGHEWTLHVNGWEHRRDAQLVTNREPVGPPNLRVRRDRQAPGLETHFDLPVFLDCKRGHECVIELDGRGRGFRVRLKST